MEFQMHKWQNKFEAGHHKNVLVFSFDYFIFVEIKRKYDWDMNMYCARDVVFDMLHVMNRNI